MKKWINILLALSILVLLFSGCAEIAKETKIKCPKCGAVFTVDEGITEIQKKGY